MRRSGKKEAKIDEKQRLIRVKTSDIRPNPNQPRRVFDENELESLAQSIRENGLLQPLTVRKTDGGYELVAGERRLRASVAAGLGTVPCVLSNVSDEQSSVLALVENIQRSDLNFFEEAEAIAKLMDLYSLTQEEAAARLGKSQPAVANKLRLLRLPQNIRSRLINARLTERHARSLLRLPDESAVSRALDIIIYQEFNVNETEKLVERMLADEKGQKPASSRKKVGAVRDMRLFCNTVEKAVRSIRSAGLPVEMERTERENCVEYTVKLPKKV